MPCTPKKTVEQIIESGNDYLIAVKGNQPKLYQHLQAQFESRIPDSVDDQTEQVRDRITRRTVSVLAATSDLDAVWHGVQSLIRVERTGIRATEAMHETLFYISSRSVDARQLGEWIRAHWHIENRLHWGKDVVFKEDAAPLCSGHAPENMAILRTIAVNLLRLNGFASMTKGIRAIAHDIDRLFSFCQ
ncbi:mobile element protein [Leptolyngbya sp. NIES-2104]|uniref:ISAs1 family transposase n=1 Tax=Leptolyngbya sp. NIES-2104 TaxID=1552121 RepID=UPI0006ECC4D7|nr:ISAs1 family transposase [Leptolyngbya sp. NIES-2104]GAP98036.1 mobile element protein [Leptolyngbya sp. NIES-2104]